MPRLSAQILFCIFPPRRYFPIMAERFNVRSAVSSVVARKRLTVADLLRRMEENGLRFDKKTIYRLASDTPMSSVNLRAVAAVGRALKLSDPGKLIDWSMAGQESARLRRIEVDAQTRLDELMDKNTEGTLTASERRELDKLGRQAEKLSLENARFLAAHGLAPNGKAAKRVTARRRRSMQRTAAIA